VLSFQGDLGAGKTTLIRAMLRALGVTGSIKSPTFSWVESYDFSAYTIHHFDLYRLTDTANLNTFGFRDYFSSDAICCIEWAERAPSLKSYLDVVFSIEMKGESQGEGRLLSVTALRPPGEIVVDHLRSILK
jgi:tRNA threonylcarbamoyladenosine biosynthesis protein TsaE